MEVYLDEITQWIFTLSPLSIYLIYFAIAYLENVIPPIPGDVFIAFGGYLAAEEIVGFTGLLLITTVSSLLGFMTMYAVGSYWGYRIEEDRERFWLLKVINVKYFVRGKRWMQKWGQVVIFANRFLAGTRSVIALTAGIYRTKINYTLISSGFSSLTWNTILLGCGWLVHENWEIIGQYLSIYGWVILSVIVLVILARVYYVKYHRSRDSKT